MTDGQCFVGADIPDDIRTRTAISDPRLGVAEQEVRLVGNKADERCTVSTELPTIVRWLQSVEESTFERVHVNAMGEILGVKASVPKGIVKLQSKARQSNWHSDMVSYGSIGGESNE